MDTIHQWLWHNGSFLGLNGNGWKVVGGLGNAIFTARFLVQWYATEKNRRVSVPAAFWWLSLLGAFVMLAYSIFASKDWVFIWAYALGWIPYGRNLILHYRHQRAQLACSECGAISPPNANFCAQCGARVKTAETPVPR